MFETLKQFLRDDFDHISKMLEGILITVGWLPAVKSGLENAVKQSAQDNLVKKDMFNLLVETIMQSITEEYSDDYLKKRKEMEPRMKELKEEIRAAIQGDENQK